MAASFSNKNKQQTKKVKFHISIKKTSKSLEIPTLQKFKLSRQITTKGFQVKQARATGRGEGERRDKQGWGPRAARDQQLMKFPLFPWIDPVPGLGDCSAALGNVGFVVTHSFYSF